MVDVAMTSPERAIEELLKVRTGFKREAGQQGKVILTGPYSLDATYNGVAWRRISTFNWLSQATTLQASQRSGRHPASSIPGTSISTLTGPSV